MGEIWNENDKRSSRLVLKCNALLLNDVFEKFRNSGLKIMDHTESLLDFTSFKLGCNG